MKQTLIALGLAAVFVACSSNDPAPSASSLIDASAREPATRDAWLQAEIDAAQAKWEFAPSEMSAVWVGRRLAYAARYEEAVKWYRDALVVYPQSYRLRRHLGHRLLTLRRVDEAVSVLTEARRIAGNHPNRLEPDGAPGPSGEPRSTTHGNIDYHLALAHYLRGEFDRAALRWGFCLDRWARNDDSRVAALHWLYTSLQRAGRADQAMRALTDAAEIDDVIENFAYGELVALYRGSLGVDELLARGERSAALDYGIARFLIARGDEERGRALLQELASQSDSAAFGVLAAEADVARLMDVNSVDRR